MMNDPAIKQQVRQFYDQVGWQEVSDGLYQNARYEDLRPVSREYIHKCHLRVNRYLKPQGRFLLDAGSGPVQYPEYLTYSKNYDYRICADISIVALQEARKRLENHGLFVVADVANLPFKSEVFDGVVSLHTLHHLPLSEQKKAYGELFRTLLPASMAVVVNGWTDSTLMRRFQWLVRLMEWVGEWILRLRGRRVVQKSVDSMVKPTNKKPNATGTFVEKLDAAWLRRELSGMDMQILVWRCVSVRFLRSVIHSMTGGKLWLRLLFGLEERFPEFFGIHGQYPLIVLRKPVNS
jgi:SAM-dependent methyltransferase